ncbi:MAG TPA: glycoside hydrolase family 38 C-terminal domain-containing protein [Ruminiclostridium sp.]
MSSEKFTIYYLSSTHWDREWYQPFQGYRYRLVSTVNEIIEVLEKDPELKIFHFDGQTIVLEDFTEIEPAKKERLKTLIQDERLVVGPWYVMPDEFLLSGESLIRNLMMGHRIAEEWGGRPWKYGYICDIFGHIAQMPQIFNGFGIKYALLGRGTNEHTTPAHFIWRSPDNSECITYKLEDKNGYGVFCIDVLGWQDKRYKDINELYPKIKEYIDYERKRSNIPIVLVMDGLDHEPIHKETPQYIEMIKELYPEAEIRQANLEEMGKELEQYKALMPVKLGELNETAKMKAGYIHLITHTLSSRYPIKKANDECQVLLEKWVEPLTAVAGIRGFPTQKTYVDLAYKYLIQNHAHDSICGCSIDQVHKDMEYRFDQSKMISNQLIDEIFNYERSQHEIDSKSETRAMLLWNPLPFKRKEVITVDIDFNTDYKTQYQEPFGYELKNSFKIFDSNGNEIPYGLISIKKNYKIRRYNQLVEQADVHTVSFEAEIPAMGTAEYKIVAFNEASRYLDSMSKNENEVENEYIKLKINDDGTLNIFDKVIGKSYEHLLSYVDDGEIGDGWFHANPVEDRVITSSGCECTVERVENGPSRTVFKIIVYMKVPESMNYHVHGISRSQDYVMLKICSLVGLSKGANHVEIETTVSNTAKDHRLRLKLPTNINTSIYFANQPFTFVERNVGVKLETQSWRECDVPEKQMGGIVGKRSDDKSGLAFVSAYGLHECAALNDEQGTILVTLFRSFQKTVLTNGEEGGQILGDLKFKYSIVPLQQEIIYADLTRLQDCLQAGIKSTSFRVAEDYVLPKPQSYIELKSDNVCLSILKRAENEEEGKIIIRIYNMSDEASEAEVNCFREIIYLEEVNLNEEYIRSLPFDKNRFITKLDPWKVQTLCLKF